MTGDSHQPREERIGPLFSFVQNADERNGFVQAGGHRRVPSGRELEPGADRERRQGWRLGRRRGTGTLAPSPSTAIDGGLSKIFPAISLTGVGRYDGTR